MVASLLVRKYGLKVALNFETLYQVVPADGAPIDPLEEYCWGMIPRFQQSHSVETEPFSDVVFLVRNPLDTLISYYYHSTRQFNTFGGNLSEFIAQWGPQWVHYINVWAEHLPRVNSLILSYEERMRDPGRTLRQVVDFAQLADVTDQEIDHAVRQSSFDNMLATEINGPLIPKHTYDPRDEGSRRVRRGKVGGWKETLSPEDVQFVGDLVQRSATTEAKKLLTACQCMGEAALTDGPKRRAA
jgi:hypothetical protein